MWRKWFEEGELTDKGRKLVHIVLVLYILLICLFCFLPQDVYPKTKTFSTPGIVQIGRLYFLPIPLNSLVNAGQVDSWVDYIWIVLQNLTNIFLLSPLVFLLLFLRPDLRSTKQVLRLSFCMSLGIECGQIVLDLLIDAGRVFEIDDLWTNTLGGLVALWAYRLAVQYLLPKYK